MIAPIYSRLTAISPELETAMGWAWSAMARKEGHAPRHLQALQANASAGNLARVYNCIRKFGPIGRTEIAKHCGLNQNEVETIVLFYRRRGKIERIKSWPYKYKVAK